MKIYKYLSMLFICFFVMAACSDDNLELSNPNDLTDDTFFKKPEQLQAAVDAIYANLQTEALYTRVIYYMFDNMAHEVNATPDHEANKLVYLNFSFTADDGYVFQFWDNCFRGVNKANFVIQNEANFENVSEEMIEKSVAEAKFMRAFYYSLLVERFGGVPLYIEPTGEGQPRSTRDEVYAQIILDLTDAAAGLSSQANTEGGRPSIGAAYALMGKSHLYMGEYANAVAAFENVTGYTLTTNFIDNFLEETEFNSESLFEVNYTLAFGNTTDWNGVGTGTGLHEYTFRGQDMGWNDWFNSYPADDLLAEFEVGDSRFDDTFYVNGDLFNNGTETVALPTSVPANAAWRKYQNYYKQSSENMASGINTRVIRYADVLLMQAEAENELGNSTDAIDLLNQVRDRVGMSNYGTVAMDATYPVGNEQEIFEAIVHERRVELAGEQVRFSDLVRWGLADEELSEFGYQTGKNEIFPIPNREINANSSISETDQNPGY
ncbi:MAG: RagB/SusD family nutrient uptake outer membrane protein [Reichenbachiella sp.]